MKVSSSGYRIASFTTIGKGELILASPRRILRWGLFAFQSRVYYNLQGDVVGLLDNSGALVVEYKYDAC